MRHTPGPMIGLPADHALLLEIVGRDLWSKEDMTEHKRAALRKEPQSKLWRKLYNVHPLLAHRAVSVPLLFVTTLTALVAYALVAHVVPSLEVAAIPASVGIVGAFLWALVALDDGPRWSTVRADDYQEYFSIPPEAQALILKIRAVMPKAKIHVSYTTWDPLLLLTTGWPWQRGALYRQPIFVWGPSGERIAPPAH